MKKRTAVPLRTYPLPGVLFTGEQLVLNEEERIVSLCSMGRAS